MNSIVKLIFPSLMILAFTKCSVLAEIKSPPYFVNQPNGKEILFYVETDDKPRSFEIPCEAKGSPAPDYVWTKNDEIFNWTDEGDRISQEAGKGTLIINVPKSGDAGRYQCYAKNIWGTATSNSVFARKIELGSFRNEPIMTKEAVKGQPFSLSCKPPYGYPKPSINWMIQDPLGKPLSIMNPRITADPTGTLWFSNVTEKDASDDSLYACVAVSSYINDIKIGPKIILQVVEPESSSEDNEDVETSSLGLPTNNDDQEIIGVPPVKQYTSKSEEIAISNTKVRLYCIFGGTPLPTITWYKNGNLMKFDTSVSLKEGRKVLEIKRSRPSDEANYTCEANNGIGDAISHTISLKILVEPKFIKKPQSVTLDEEETVEFHCQASGNPTPEIIWTYNGKPLSEAPPNPRRAVSANSIVIEKLVESDTGNYGCNASNSVGYVYQDAYVNVLAEAPSIIEISQGKEILQGEKVTLKCRGEGSPKPQITWLRNDVELTGDRFTMTKNGDLTINNVDIADTGNYICLAQNKISSINATVNLEVRQPTKIPPGSGPSNTTVAAGESATLRCSPQTDPSLDRSITWLHNDESIDFGSENFTQANDDSLIIKHANELDAGIYSCVASTRLDSATAEASLSIKRIPYPPELLMLSCDSTGTVGISWLDKGYNSEPVHPYIIAPVDHHVIQYSTSFPPDMWETLENVNVSQDTSQFHAQIQMKPWSNHTFRVLSVNEFGTSLPSHPSQVCSIPPDTPYKNPDNVSVQIINATTSSISWEPLARTEHNGPGFYYNVSWKLDALEAEWHSQIIPEWEQREYQIHNLLPNHKYFITVGAGNDQGPARSSAKLIECTTPPDIPYKNPENVTVKPINSTTLSISWKAMSIIDHNGPEFYYNVSWKLDSPEDEWHSQIIPSWETREYQIHNLLPHHKYFVTVGAGNAQGQTQSVAELVESTTLPDKPYKNPDNVSVQATTPTTFTISWKPMPETEHNGPGFHYNVSWKREAPEAEWQSHTIPDWQTQEYTVLDAVPYEKYLVTVLAGNNLGKSESTPEAPKELTTPPDIPYKNPNNVTVYATEPTTLQISWEPMPKSDHNGPNFYYNVSWKKDEPNAEWQSQIISEWEKGQFTIPNVLPYEKYIVKVQSGNGQGPTTNLTDDSTSSESTSAYMTPPSAPFKNPDDVAVQATDPTTLVITWKPMPKTEHNGPGFYYNVWWKVNSNETDWENQTISDWETGKYTVVNALPYEEHLVKVTVGNDQGESVKPPIIVKGYYEEEVPLEAPKNLALVKIISPTIAEVSWDRVPMTALRGNFQKYEIETWPEHDQQEDTVLKKTIEHNFDHTVIDQLTPNTKNIIRISVFNGKHQSAFSEELEIDMPEGVPEPVQSLESKPLGSSALALTWKPPLTTNGNLTGYKIYYQQVSGTESGPLRERTPQITDPTQTQAKLLDLEPDTNYRIHITATTSAWDGEVFSIEQKTPSPSSALIQPDFQIVPIDSKNSTSLVKIVWLPCGANEEDCNDQSIGSEFRVSYRLRGDTDFEEIVERDKDNVIIDGLLPDKDYEFMVTSIDGRLVATSDVKTFKIDAPNPEISSEEPSQITSTTPEEVSTTPTDAEKFVSEQSSQTPAESTTTEIVLTQQSSTTQNTTTDSFDLTKEPVEGTKNEALIGWIILSLAIVFLIVLLIIIAIYLKNLTQRNTYIIEEKEIKNGRPDWYDDTEVPLSHAEAPDISSSLSSIQGGSDMVMIPLN